MSYKKPIISVGQLYLNEPLNEYLIVTANSRHMISYAGDGFSGKFDSTSFIDRFQPVDPEDVEQEEIDLLLSFCPADTVATTGFYEVEDDDDEEFEDDELVDEAEPIA